MGGKGVWGLHFGRRTLERRRFCRWMQNFGVAWSVLVRGDRWRTTCFPSIVVLSVGSQVSVSILTCVISLLTINRRCVKGLLLGILRLVRPEVCSGTLIVYLEGDTDCTVYCGLYSNCMMTILCTCTVGGFVRHYTNAIRRATDHRSNQISPHSLVGAFLIKKIILTLICHQSFYLILSGPVQ